MHELPLATEELQTPEKNFWCRAEAVAYAGQAGVDEAVASGELMRDPPKRQFEAGTQKATNKSQHVTGQSKIDKDAYNTLKPITFSIEFTESELKQIEDGMLTEGVLAKIRKAGLACNIAINDSDKILKKVFPVSINAKAEYKKLVESKKVDIGIVLW